MNDWIGINSSGTAAIPNLAGIAFIDASGWNAAINNVISGNSAYGIFISQYSSVFGSSGNLVQGNYIGTNLSGTGAIANNGPGIYVAGGSAFNTIGGITATAGTGAGNLISGNAGVGVELNGAGIANVIEGNLIGTTESGNAVLGNAGFGVSPLRLARHHRWHGSRRGQRHLRQPVRRNRCRRSI